MSADNSAAYILCSFSAGAFSGKEARAAKNRASLRWIEGNRRLLAALSALHRNFYALSHSRGLRSRNSSQAFILGLFARLASLWFVFEALVVEKYLLSRSPNKVLVTVYALDCPILIFTIVSRFQCCRRFHLCHVVLP